MDSWALMQGRGYHKHFASMPKCVLDGRSLTRESVMNLRNGYLEKLFFFFCLSTAYELYFFCLLSCSHFSSVQSAVLIFIKMPRSGVASQVASMNCGLPIILWVLQFITISVYIYFITFLVASMAVKGDLGVLGPYVLLLSDTMKSDGYQVLPHHFNIFLPLIYPLEQRSCLHPPPNSYSRTLPELPDSQDLALHHGSSLNRGILLSVEEARYQ